jgi:hypothetical protein
LRILLCLTLLFPLLSFGASANPSFSCRDFFARYFNGKFNPAALDAEQVLIQGAKKLSKKDRAELKAFLLESVDPKSGEFHFTERQASEWQKRKRIFFPEPAQVNEKGRLIGAPLADEALFEEIVRRIPPYRDMDEFQQAIEIRKLAKGCE